MAAILAVNATACTPRVRFGPALEHPGWPDYLGSPRRDGSALDSLPGPLEPVWHTDGGRSVRGSPALGDSVLAVASSDRFVTLIERRTGDILWRSRAAGTVAAGPLLRDDRLFVATEATPDARVSAVRLRDGKRLWQRAAAAVTAPLALDGDLVIAGTETGVVLALDAATGVVRWMRRLSGGIRAQPVVTASGIVVCTVADSVFLLGRSDGAITARSGSPGAVIASPATDGRTLYAATATGHIRAFALPGLTTRWERPAGDVVFGSPVLVGDTLFVLARDGTLSVIPVATPEETRVLSLRLATHTGPTPFANGVVVAGLDGTVLVVDRRSGATERRLRVAGPIDTPPLVQDGTLLVVGGDGEVHLYR